MEVLPHHIYVGIPVDRWNGYLLPVKQTSLDSKQNPNS